MSRPLALLLQVGDVEFGEAKKNAGFITPVPGAPPFHASG